MKGDLHCHSICSDGATPLPMLLRYAMRAGLDYLALTDHDTMLGVAKLKDLAKGLPIKIISGVECTTKDFSTGRPVHVLCYNPQKPEVLQDLLSDTSCKRKKAKLKMAEKIHKLYPMIDVLDVIDLAKDSASIFECHLMMALSIAGITNDPFGPLMDQLIGKNGICYEPISYPDVNEVIDLMHQSQGMVVIAHPGQFDSLDLVLELAKQKKIDGIECMHYKNTLEVTNRCLSIANSYELIATGGSDFHGMYAKVPHPIGYKITDSLNSDKFLQFIEQL